MTETRETPAGVRPPTAVAGATHETRETPPELAALCETLAIVLYRSNVSAETSRAIEAEIRATFAALTARLQQAERARDTTWTIAARLLEKLLLHHDGLVEYGPYVFGFTDDGDLCVWTPEAVRDGGAALEAFFAEDPEAEAVEWLAATLDAATAALPTVEETRG